jgi:hypothetical protein
MTRFAAALAGMAVIIMANVTISISEIHAAPPTVVPSPGYDARLQESRSAPMAAPPTRAMPAVAYSGHRRRLHRHRRDW